MTNKQQIFQLNLTVQRKVDGSYTQIASHEQAKSARSLTFESDSFDFLVKNWKLTNNNNRFVDLG